MATYERERERRSEKRETKEAAQHSSGVVERD